MSVMTVVTPLGSWYADAKCTILDDASEKRCIEAIKIIISMKERGEKNVSMALASGQRPGYPAPQYLAVAMERWVRSNTLKNLPSFPIMANYRSPHVWATHEEVEWVIFTATSYAGDEDDINFVFVTSQRHSKRVRFLLNWYFPGAKTSVRDTDLLPPTPLWYEMGAWAKMIFYMVFEPRRA